MKKKKKYNFIFNAVNIQIQKKNTMLNRWTMNINRKADSWATQSFCRLVFICHQLQRHFKASDGNKIERETSHTQRKWLPPAFAIYQSDPRMLSASVLLYSILSLSAAAAKNRNVNFQRNGRLKPHKILPMFRNTWNVPQHNSMRFHQTQPSSDIKAFLRNGSFINS